jgi:hypothetical protein
MKKNFYNQPSVNVTDITMVQTLCASGVPVNSGTNKLNNVPTNEQW